MTKELSKVTYPESKVASDSKPVSLYDVLYYSLWAELEEIEGGEQ